MHVQTPRSQLLMGPARTKPESRIWLCLGSHPLKSGRNTLHAVVTTYSGKGAKEIVDAVEKNKADLESRMRGIKGFVSYSAVRTADGCFSVSVFHDKAGTDESVRVAREWIAKNAGNTGAAAPSVFEGAVVLHTK